MVGVGKGAEVEEGHGDGVRRLRALTYLAPGLPFELFELVAQHLARTLELEIVLAAEERSSGPMHGEENPFAAEAAADLGFLCSPSYIYLRAQAEPSVELVPAGFVFADPRSDDKPVYFSEVVVRVDHPAATFADLEGAAWGFNDECSLSGYYSALQRLSELGCAGDFFGRRVRTGSHEASLEALARGEIDGAAIDSTVLSIQRRARPELDRELRVIESWGPFPVQPIVVRTGLGPGWPERIATALLALDTGPLGRFGLRRLAPIDDAAYAEERRALCELGQIHPDPTSS